MNPIRAAIFIIGVLATIGGVACAAALAMQLHDEWSSFAENRDLLLQCFILAVLCYIALRPADTRGDRRDG